MSMYGIPVTIHSWHHRSAPAAAAIGYLSVHRPPPPSPIPLRHKTKPKKQNKKTDQQSLELHKWCVFRIYRWGETIAKWCLPRAAISHIRAHEHQTNKAKSSLLHSPAKVAKSSGTMNEKNKQKKDSCKTSVTLREPVKVEGLHAKEHKFKFSCSTFCCCCCS